MSSLLRKSLFRGELNKLSPFMARQAHHVRTQPLNVLPEPGEGFNQRFLVDLSIRHWLIPIALCLIAFVAQAESVVPAFLTHVTDLTATLTAEQRAVLEARLVALEQKKGSQVGVLIVPTTQPETIEQYSLRVVETWKLGRKGVDDGVLLLVAKNDHKLRIEVGYGLEGALPDVIAKRIITEVITPEFKKENFFTGISYGVDKIMAAINSETLPEPHWAEAQHFISGLTSFFEPSERTKNKVLEMLLLFYGGLLTFGSWCIWDSYGKYAGWTWIVFWIGVPTGITVWVIGLEALLYILFDWIKVVGITMAACLAILLGVAIRKHLGKIVGAVVNATICGFTVWFLNGKVELIGFLTLIVFFITLGDPRNARGNSDGIDYNTGSSDSGAGSTYSGGSSGGGGDFGGGGASGDW